MKKPIIGISSSIIIDASGDFAGYWRSYVNTDYVRSVIKNGGVPMIIPFHTDEEVTKQQMSLCDGLLLSGGQDVSPMHYGQEPSQRLGDTFPERDRYEYSLISEAMQANKPILGICRGLQIINTYFKGTLYQDLSYIGGEVYKHSQGKNPKLATHHAYLEEHTKLYNIFGCDQIMVNSFHHQAIHELGEGLKISARARDGVIEAIEKEDYPFLLAVQWHPEMLHESCEEMNKIFRAHIAAC